MQPGCCPLLENSERLRMIQQTDPPRHCTPANNRDRTTLAGTHIQPRRCPPVSNKVGSYLSRHTHQAKVLHSCEKQGKEYKEPEQTATNCIARMLRGSCRAAK
jgi:hypothetical protein